MFRMGLVGYGGFGHFLHQAWQSLPNVQLVAVADPVATPPPGIRGERNWQMLLADPTIDAIAIATPPHTHATIACAAMEAGKHVLIEKPPALTQAEAQRLRETQVRTGRVAVVDFVLRYTPLVALMQRWSHMGCFGPLRRVIVENYAQDATLPPAHWFWDPAQSGGILVEHGIHFIDLVNACTSATPVHVAAYGVRRNKRQTDRVLATVVYEDGLMATHYHAFAGPGFFEHTSIRFIFDLARIELTGWIPQAGRLVALVSPASQAHLQELPGLQIIQRVPVADLPDQSRPEGWGLSASMVEDRSHFQVGEHVYSVDTFIEATFALAASKAEIYQEGLRAVLQDFVRAATHPDGRPRVSLEESLRSLHIALEAQAQAFARAVDGS